jgi:hypothetical protein
MKATWTIFNSIFRVLTYVLASAGLLAISAIWLYGHTIDPAHSGYDRFMVLACPSTFTKFRTGSLQNQIRAQPDALYNNCYIELRNQRLQALEVKP